MYKIKLWSMGAIALSILSFFWFSSLTGHEGLQPKDKRKQTK